MTTIRAGRRLEVWFVGRRDRLSAFALACAAFCLAVAVPATAQMGPMGMEGGRGGGGGGFADRFVVGQVADLNPVRGYIQVTSAGSDEPRIVVTTPDTVMTRETQGTVADLKVGDTVSVSGVPVQISALRIGVLPPEAPTAAAEATATAPAASEDPPVAQAPAPVPPEERRPRSTEPNRGPGGPGGPGGFGGPRGRRGSMGGGGGPGMFPGRGRFGFGGESAASPGEWSATGVVKSLDPLTVELDTGQTVTLTVSDATRIATSAPATMDDVHQDDVVGAIGHPNDDGYLQADKLFIGSDEREMMGIVMREARGIFAAGPGRGFGLPPGGQESTAPESAPGG
jgi:hypothetical protein